MSEIKHTAEPWNAIAWSSHAQTSIVIDDSSTLTGNRVIAECTEEQDARRIVACVNACAGLDDPEFVIQSMKQRIESFSFGASAITLSQLERQRDKLLAALKKCAAVCAGEVTTKQSLIDALELARDILAEIEAEK